MAKKLKASVLSVYDENGGKAEIPAIRGQDGTNGRDGIDGYTPIKGEDYFTEADKAEFEAYIATELAKRGQLKPEFANTLEECTDTAKLYALPDGFLYAYMLKTVDGSTTPNFTNQLPIAEDIASTTPFNGCGYMTGNYLTSSTPFYKAGASNDWATGYIPYTVGKPIYIKGTSYTSASHDRMFFFSDKETRVAPTVNSGDQITTCFTVEQIDDYYKLTPIESADWDSSIQYVRMGFTTGTPSDVIITIDKPITYTTTEGGTVYEWKNTGHAFVPADYEDRILDLEKRMDAVSADTEGAFTYIAEEAKRVADIVQAKRTVGSLTFTAMSDCHVEADTTNAYGLKNNLTSCRDAGLGLSELQKHLKLDFTAMLGDYTWGSNNDTVAQVKKDLSYVKNCMAEGMRGIPGVWCTGNHDINYGADSDRRMTEDELYAYLTGNNKDTIQDRDNIGRNYGYIDFENQKIRCIYLNTVDVHDYPDNTDGTADDAMEITAVQAQWLVNVGLDFSKKSNPTEWGIVILSHHCLCQFQHVTAILTAYREGTNGSVDVTTNGITKTVNYDFTPVNRGEIVCAVHGHNHNFIAKKISSEPYNQITEANAWLWSIGVANMDTTRNNEAATSSDTSFANAFGEFDENGTPVYYPKTQGTRTSTSFCVITIDRKNRKIHAIAYGAGCDREIGY